MSDSKHVIAVSVRPHLHAAIKVIADREMCSISDLMRRTMIEMARSHGLDPLARPASPAGAGPLPAAAAGEQRVGA